MTGESTYEDVDVYGDFIIHGYYGGEVQLPSAYEWNDIPNSTGEFANSTNIMEQPHLKHLADQLPPPMDIPVGLLIGANCTSASFPLEAIRSGKNEPYALKTEIGWAVYGVKEEARHKSKVHSTTLTTNNEEDGNMLSQEDYQFLEMMENETTVTDAGNYMMPLPFKERPALPNNYQQAIRRQEGLEKRFEKDEELKLEYNKFMQELISEELVETVNEEQEVNPGEKWYIPHFAVRHPQKQKLRVVFDCKAPYSGTSLNDHLLQGPDMMNSLLGILCRFRRESIAISCDIQKMFYNFLVPPQDRDYLRFLWYGENGQPQSYRMKVHLFGAKSSPAVATFGLRKIAQDHGMQSKQAAAFINRDFYVDDGITSVASEEEAIDLINSARALCAKGNLRLHKFTSNSPTVLAALPESERSVQDKDLLTNSLPEQRTLGLQWCMASDSFKFVNKVQAKPNTRRGVLSIVSQLYDPLGFIAPYTLLGKNIMQELNKADLDWDEPIPEEILERWQQWMEQLPAIERISIPRCIKPKDFGEVVRMELHHFSDASDDGIGACSYSRLVNREGKIHVSFMLGKSRVIPSKGLFTTPRLELMAAVMATQLSEMLHKEIDMKIDEEFFWSDSTITLGWIANASKRFHAFVHNRVREITAHTDIQQWKHIPGQHNPADIASRGMQCDKLSGSMWFSGPQFLKETNIEELLNKQEDFTKALDLNDPELKRVKVMKTVATPSITERFKKFSSWNKLVHSVAVVRNFRRTGAKSWTIDRPTTDDKQKAKLKIISEVQKNEFPEDYKLIKDGREVGRGSSLFKLNPFIDSDEVLRIGGRLEKSAILGYGEKHPMVLPRDSHIASLIVRYVHNTTHHQGRTSTLAALRSAGFWIVGATRLVKSILHKCVTCNALRGKPIKQIMSVLPAERLDPTPPFTNIAIDCFGPFTVKERRSELKRWGLLFTCLYSRAVHIEILNDMTTDAMLNALRSFICLRGAVKTLYCDQGTNFVGAHNELSREMQAMSSDSALAKYLKERQIEFRFNAPHASHAGGAWERQIRSVRSVLSEMMRGKYSNRLDTAALRTAFYEAMATVNSRPIAVNNLTDPESPMLTPNHLLTAKPSIIDSPPGSFDSTEIYGNKMWKKTQQFAEEFWKIWKSEYLSKITKRQRWERPAPNVAIGDIVLLVEENAPRNHWHTGIVDEVFPGKDGMVRKVKVKLANSALDNRGKTTSSATSLERPIQKLIMLQKVEEK